jgi:transposase
MRNRRSAAFKAQIVQELLGGEKSISELASKHKLHPTVLSHWKSQAVKGLPSLFERSSAKERESKVREDKEKEALYEQIGRLTTQLIWLKKKSGINPDA